MYSIRTCAFETNDGKTALLKGIYRWQKRLLNLSAYCDLRFSDSRSIARLCSPTIKIFTKSELKSDSGS